jgi:predicted nucleotidyltransferase
MKLQTVVIPMNPFLKLFANPSLAETLGLFLLNPEEEFYQAHIVKKIGHGLIQVQRALKILEEIGLISSLKRGRMVYYRAIRTHPGFEDLKKLFFKTLALGESIRKALMLFHSKIYWAFIFGSVARGDESTDSDIDLFIIADLTLRELSKALGPLSKELQRELNPILFSREEFLKRFSDKDHFIIEVTNAKKIWILGDENEFKNMVKEEKLKVHSTSQEEISKLFKIVNRDLADAEISGLSPDRKFITAYNAALQLATIVLRTAGFRTNPNKTGHHRISIDALDEILGKELE